MPAFARCPACARRFRLPSSTTTAIQCPFCDARVKRDECERDVDDGPSSRRVRPRRQLNTATLLLAGLGGGAAMMLLLCAGGVGIAIWRLRSTPSSLPPMLGSSTSLPEQQQDYAQARQQFQTKLLRQGPAPQQWQSERPPPGVRQVAYRSGDLNLRAWVSGPPPDNRQRPAVLFLHGGFAFGADDWEQTQPFRDAGFLVMTPTLRGENGLPGAYSMFYNEVDDVLAAAATLAQLPYVDSKRIYVAGHSVGGTLTMLAAMTSDRFRAAASFSGSPDQVAWTQMQPLLLQSRVAPFNRADPREFQMRSPLSFAHSFKCPARLYYGSQEQFFASSSQRTAQLAKAAGCDVEALSVVGDHGTMVEPAMRLAIAFFQQK